MMSVILYIIVESMCHAVLPFMVKLAFVGWDVSAWFCLSLDSGV